MLRFFATFLIACSLPCTLLASHYVSLLVYHEYTHIQGPWKNADQLMDFDDRYLLPSVRDTMLGTEPQELAQAIIEELAAHKPHLYPLRTSFYEKGDTAFITLPKPVEDFRTVRNELIASFLAQNGWNRIHISTIGKGVGEFYSVNAIDVPVFRVETPAQTNPKEPFAQFDSIAIIDPEVRDFMAVPLEEEVVEVPWKWLFYGSLAVAVALAVLLVLGRSRRT